MGVRRSIGGPLSDDEWAFFKRLVIERGPPTTAAFWRRSDPTQQRN
jgi:hypothetical protein